MKKQQLNTLKRLKTSGISPDVFCYIDNNDIIELMQRKKFFIACATFVSMLSFCCFVFIANAETAQQAVDAKKAKLEAELASLEKEIESQREILTEKQREKVSLERDVAILDAQINEATLSIKARNLSIQKLNSDIGGKEDTISALSAKLTREKESLAQILRKTNELDSFSLVEVMLSGDNLSNFFADLDSFQTIEKTLKESFEEIETTKQVTSRQKDILEDKKSEEIELRTIQELQKKKIGEKRSERETLLKVTKGQESVYKKILSEKEKDANAIRNALFALRDSAAIPFGEALEYANMAYAKTGVRPAFVLGILTQESNLGENTGQCLLTNNPNKGDGKGKNTGRFFANVMKGSRDVDPFVELSKRIGFDPYGTPVSCPPGYGYGGAMGPAQFIPSTWVLFEDEISRLTGHSTPNPWNAEDAIMASALLLRDNGAAKSVSTCTKTDSPEKCAALRYFAGWKNANKSAYQFYGNGVMELAGKIQHQIDILQAN